MADATPGGLRAGLGAGWALGAVLLGAGCGDGSPGGGGGVDEGGASGSGGSVSTTGGASSGGVGSTQGGTGTGGKASGGSTTSGGTKATGGSATATGGTTSGTGGSSTASGCDGTVSVNTHPFGCEFAWGANGNQGNRAALLDFITTWVGYEWSQGNEDSCDGCGLARDLSNGSAMAVYYAYFAGYALDDCNVNPRGPNLCTDGAAWIRDNRDYYIDLYAQYARRTQQSSPNKGVVWLLEGDFVQYTYDEQNRPFSMQELGQLAEDVICAIKSNEPDAIVAVNHSPWIADDLTDEFWNAMPLDLIDMVWTTGVGDNQGFINGDATQNTYNATTATYRYLHELTGKRIWVDTSFGLSQQGDSWSDIGATELNRRIEEGVIAASVTDPSNDYPQRVSAMTGLDPVCD